jgi:hypothetical protein
VENGVPEADVLLDNVAVGKVAPDGTFRFENVAPGRHELVLRKQNFEDTRAAFELKVKETMRLNGRMRQYGALAVHVTPPNATVTYRLAGEQPVGTSAERTISVKSGSYEVEATAPGYQPKRTVVDIQPGQTAPVNLALAALPVTEGKKREAERRISSEALDSASWRRTDDGWSTRGPSGYGWSTANIGIFDIQIRQVKAKLLGFVPKNKRVEFVADYVDDRNLVLYSWDWQNLTVKEISQGKNKAERKQAMKAGDGSGVHFELEITGEKIVVRQDGREIDAVSRSLSRSPGKFGFKGEVEVKVTRR